ncbi:MAG: ABC transporter permease [Gammaproteobacteria bacterium]|nr:ABC transporter permease [Gammaproteobacteria bacterium]
MFEISLFIEPLWQTIYMVFFSSLLAMLFGIPLGVVLFITRPHHILSHEKIHRLMNMLVSGLRSIPFIILMIALIPFTRFLVGTSIGTTAAIVPLAVCAIPFLGKVVESVLSEVSSGLIEAAQSMGASTMQIILKVLLPEALPGLIQGVTLTVINLIAYSAMAGTIGGGGLGDLAIRYGYQRFDTQVMLLTIVILILLVQFTQFLGDLFVKRLRR